MRRITLLIAALALLILGAAPAMADYPPEVIVDPGESVQIIDGIFISVETNGDVFVTDGIFVKKFSTGGQPTQIQVGNDNITTIIITPGGCDLKCI